jgi:hypothetical protein
MDLTLWAIVRSRSDLRFKAFGARMRPKLPSLDAPHLRNFSLPLATRFFAAKSVSPLVCKKTEFNWRVPVANG